MPSTITSLRALNQQLLADNATREITAAKHRAFNDALIDFLEQQSTDTYPDGTTTNVTVGALPAGSDVGGETDFEVQRKMIITFIAPSVSLTLSGAVHEKGDVITTVNYSYSTSNGNDTRTALVLKWKGSVVATLTGSSGSGTINLSTIDPDGPQTIYSGSGSSQRTFTLEGTFTQSGVKTSTAAYSFISPYFYGVGDTAQNVSGLTKVVGNPASIPASLLQFPTLTFITAGNRWKFIYPTRYGAMIKFYDAATNTEYASGFLTSTFDMSFADSTVENYTMVVFSQNIIASTTAIDITTNPALLPA